MRGVFNLALLLILTSCSKQEIQRDRLDYELNMNQDVNITIDIIPTENVELYYDEMFEELNADYYNRYGISINFNLKSRQELPHKVKDENHIFLPRQGVRGVKKLNIAVYIIPKEYMYIDKALGYAHEVGNSIIIREDAQLNRTLAHELAHIFGVDHSDDINNIMSIGDTSSQFSTPQEFNKEQINIIKNNIMNYGK